MKTVFAIAAVVAIFFTLYAAPSVAETDGADYVIVANKQLPGASINMTALKGIYLREVLNWGKSEGEIVPVDLANSNGFYQNLFGKSYVQMQAYWLNMRIKYSMNLPVTKKDAESVKEYIAANKNAIGFLRSSDLDDRVKVLKVVN